MAQKTFAFFPEAAFGPALNSVGIAQAIEARGHKAVFLSDPGFVEVYEGYGFEAHPVNLSEPMPPEQMAKFWEDFINGHIPNFRKAPIDQIDNYPYVWDGHDNAMRVQETGHGLHLNRYEWTDEELLEAIETCLSDEAMRSRLEATSAHMQSRNGPEKAADLLESLV